MSNKKGTSSAGGISTLGMLGVAFVVMKLTGYIDWSWWYVTMPFWGGIALVIAGFLIFILYKLIKYFIARRKYHKESNDPERGINISENYPKKKSAFVKRVEAMEKKRSSYD